MVTRQFAPVAAPPPPKPPQLNIVASSIMPDVDTDTFGPGDAPEMVASCWDENVDGATGRRVVHKLPGDESYRFAADRHNEAIIAAGGLGISSMSDIEMEQSEQAPATGAHDPRLPVSLFPATSSEDRWEGGFAYAPENQYVGELFDACAPFDTVVDLPAIAAPVVVAATSTAAGTLTAATYYYAVTAVNGNGESLAGEAHATLGATGEIVLTWSAQAQGRVDSWNIYGRPATSGGTFGLITNVSGATLTFTDTGSLAPNNAVNPPVSDSTAGKGSYSNLAQVLFVPFLIAVEDECSTWGWSVRDYVGRALRLLDNATPNAIERELWGGAFAQQSITGPMNGSNAFFQQSGTPASGGTSLAATDLTPGAGPPSVTRGIQILEDYLANTGFGGQGMLHVAPETSPNLLGARRLGALLLSVMDNIIVPGSGYPTTGATGPIGNSKETPDAGTQWIFATDLVSVRLGPPVITPTTMAEALDRGTSGEPNTIRVRAQRAAAATWDGGRLAACRVTLAT